VTHNDDLSRTRAARQPDDWKLVHKAAGKIERRMARAVQRSTQRVRNLTTITELAQAISFGNVDAAMRLFPKEAVRDAYAPVGTIARDAVGVGGRIAANLVREEARKAGLL